MSDLSDLFVHLLGRRGAAPSKRSPLSQQNVDEFLKEAYRINSQITRLHADLHNVRQAYLSTAAPLRRAHVHQRPSSQRAKHPTPQQRPMTDRDREEVDADAKLLIRRLDADIRALHEAETLRQGTEAALIRKKHGRALGVLASWASGGNAGRTPWKSPDQVAAEEALGQLGLHRESVVQYLRLRLQETVRTQKAMMETRLTREMEKNRSVLAKARAISMAGHGAGERGGAFGAPAPAAGTLNPGPGDSYPGGSGSGSGNGNLMATTLPIDDVAVEPRPDRDELTQEQRQMFEQGNQDMIQHFESTLDKVRTAEKSLVEISELQTLLVNNLTVQSEHIDQLVADSHLTADNVGGGNKQLQKATERGSMARYTFFAATGLCIFLIGWDLVV